MSLGLCWKARGGTSRPACLKKADLRKCSVCCQWSTARQCLFQWRAKKTRVSTNARATEPKIEETHLFSQDS